MPHTSGMKKFQAVIITGIHIVAALLAIAG
jgi:hypothetical protein